MKFKSELRPTASALTFRSEDEAYDAYLEHVQSECPFDITEWDQDFSDGFFDWMDANNVEIVE